MDSAGPTTLFAACAEPIAVARATPLATKRVRIMVATSSMVRLIKRPPLSVEGRRKKGVRPPPRYVTKAAYSCLRGVYVRHGTKYYRAPRKHRTSENPHSLKLLAGSGVVAPPLFCCISYVRTKRVRSCVHKKHNTRRYGRPLAGSLGPIGVRLCTLSRQRELRLNGVLRSSHSPGPQTLVCWTQPSLCRGYYR